MRHLSIVEYGHNLSCNGDRLVVKDKSSVVLETPLSRLRTISISKKGVSLSSNLIIACANRGIRLFFLDWRGVNVVALSGKHQHAVAAVRVAQFEFIKSTKVSKVSAEIISTKLRNQRAVLLYFAKYYSASKNEKTELIYKAGSRLAKICDSIKNLNWERQETWRKQLMGYEGAGAAIYWKVIKEANLATVSFEKRVGRGSMEIFNQALNYGYTLLLSYIWSALDNAGFELYAGFFHQERAGKPSLVLDIMEEYRPWVVDRCIIAMRHELDKHLELDIKLKQRISREIQSIMAKYYPYKSKRIRLENILQRQVYCLAGTVIDEKRYRGYKFKW